MPEENQSPNSSESAAPNPPGTEGTVPPDPAQENRKRKEDDTETVINENINSISEATASSLPSANKPDQEPTGPAGRAPSRAAKAGKSEVEGDPAGIEQASADQSAKAPKAAAKAKKERPPAVEDKPFAEFINQDFLPSLTKTLSNQGIKDLKLEFVKQKLPVRGVDNTDIWQVIGFWNNGQRQFIIGFLKEDINAQKVFCCAEYGARPSLLESFMIDERKVSLDLLLLYTLQRLNGQKWLVAN